MISKNKDTMERRKFWEHIEKCVNIIKTWPKWKRDIKVTKYSK